MTDSLSHPCPPFWLGRVVSGYAVRSGQSAFNEQD
jgi:hypothetical protein